MKAYLLVVVVAAASLSALAQNTSNLPHTEGETLAGTKLTLPDAVSGKYAVLIFGFTRGSKKPTSEWANKVRTDFGTAPLELYQIPVLEDVPHLIRGMVVSGIRKGVPENQRDHFLIVVKSERELKQFVDYKEPDDAYLVSLDPTGKVIQQLHGSPTPDTYARLKQALDSLPLRQH